ncbi:hypothetical protein MMC16_003869 [Acarospora aff. strigata]|nr:hypothetical protein [Acarospora aff. strigata]
MKHFLNAKPSEYITHEVSLRSSTCRGVLGPKPKDPPKSKDLKDLVKPILGGAKRKLQQALDDTIDTATKKRKLANPSSVKAALNIAKSNTGKRLVKAKVYASTGPSSDRLIQSAPSSTVCGVVWENGASEYDDDGETGGRR